MKGKKICLIIFIIFFAIISTGAIGGYLFAKRQLATPISQNDDEVLFEVSEGDGVAEIANDLEKAGLIKYPWLFIGYNKYEKTANNLKAGKYILRANMTIPEISNMMFIGSIGEWLVTFPEGFKIKEIAQRLSDKGIVDYDDFINEVENGKFEYEFLSDRSEGVGLEGFLFPDTYNFSLGVTSREIINKMLSNFDDKLTSQMREDIKNKGLTIHETVIFSSIIEKEVAKDEDRKIVSDIFYGRLNLDYPLESCATVEYILGENKERLSYEDTRIESPYNTYLNSGLPAGPICNPGISSIEAVIYPISTDYFYFFSTPDDQIIYSKTFEEHQINQQKYLE